MILGKKFIALPCADFYRQVQVVCMLVPVRRQTCQRVQDLTQTGPQLHEHSEHSSITGAQKSPRVALCSPFSVLV